MALQRLQNWTTLLASYIELNRGTSFEWGVNDCCLFVASCIKEMTGVDPAEQWRGAYTSKDGALHLASVRGYDGLPQIANAMAAQYDIPACSPYKVGRGDVIMFKSNGLEGLGYTMAIVDVSMCHSVGLEGLQAVPLASVWNDSKTKAWKIG